MNKLTHEQLHVLQHSLGVDKYGQGQMYRNHFCAAGDNVATCKELVAMGYMINHQTTDMVPYYNCTVTDAGREAVRNESPPAPKLTRSQKRYREYLDADSGLTFIEWIRERAKVTK